MKINKWKVVIGVILLPVLVALYMVDRLILVLLIHLDSVNFLKWSDNVNHVMNTLIRTSIIAIIYGIIYSLKLLF